ncbi:MAG: hypothetical protein JRN15_11250 [Nitrososphaerota archaeon]|nr:hypothetical protein [Nitrososphaerota archaeon]
MKKALFYARRNKRRALSSIVGGIIIFGMIFTVGFGYFYSVTQAQQAYQKTIMSYQQSSIQQAEESLLITPSATGNLLQLTVNNTGVGTNIVGYWIINNTMTLYYSTNSTPALPIFLSQGATTNVTNIVITTGTEYLIKVLTSRGSIFTATYPSAAVSLASQALSSGAIGDLYLTFHSFTYYKIESCGSSSGYCLGTSGSAFVIPAGDGNIAFSVTLTNLNNEHYSIVLDQFTLIYQNSFYGNNHQNFYTWYVVSNDSSDILSTYTPIIVPYDTPTTVVFASGNCIKASTGPNDCSSSFSPQSAPSNAGSISASLIMSHGWEVLPPVSLSSLTYSSSNYGQDSPFVSTLYE